MRFLRYAIPSFVMSLVSIGCGSNGPAQGNPPSTDAAVDAATSPEAGSACGSDDDCGRTMFCGFDIAAGCGAPGSCRIREENGVCSPDAFITVCTCTGGTVTYCREPSPMYTSTRVAHAGPCGDGGADAGAD